MAKTPEPPCGRPRPPGTQPSPAEAAGVLLLAGAALAAVLVLVGAPFTGPWRVVLAVAVVFAGIHAGCLLVGCTASLRLPVLLGRLTGVRARRG